MNPQPILIVVTGPPCTGKTTLAQELSRQMALDFGAMTLELDTSDLTTIDRTGLFAAIESAFRSADP